MSVRPVVFARPDGELVPLGVAPRLASWMGDGHTDQVQLERFLTHAVHMLTPALSEVADPLALRLDVCLPAKTRLLDANDLDNYVFPLTMRLTKVSKRQVACVWATKRHGTTSLIGIEQAVLLTHAEPAGGWVLVHTTASSETSVYKQQIHAALQMLPELPPGPVSLELSFTVGPGRNWLNLWKPTIDALSPLLGQAGSSKPWNPQDGRIVQLGLHRQVEQSRRHDVLLAIAARPYQE
jgi:hypothetical protein